MSDEETFLRRWSRRKHESAQASEAESVQVDSMASPQLPSVDDLAFDSDFKDFMRPEVDRETRKAALKKLFMSPHYRATDGLDVYVGDYSSPDPLPAAMLAGLVHARGLFAGEKSDAPADSGMPLVVEPKAETAKVKTAEAASKDQETKPADGHVEPSDQG